MVADMGYDIEIIGVPTVRANDGLALSSRNGYLTADERKTAPTVSEVMNHIAEQLSQDNHNVEELIISAENSLAERGLKADGLAIVDAETLLPLNVNSKRAVILMAAWLGKARLIDNQVVDLRF